MNPADTPLLLIAWRRPHNLRQVLDAIRPIAPTRIYVACDGPNPDRPGEAEKVAATRTLIEQSIDWSCTISRLYSDTNLGCRVAVSRAISWFFQHVEEGIILEDDCVPHHDFFLFCTKLLQRYRHDTRVWSICGSNFQLGNHRGDASYFFSIHGDSWGWASWRRAWSYYPSAELNWTSFRDSGRLNDIFPIPLERDYWRHILDKLFIKGEPSAWDYQWWLASWMNNGLHAWPNSCLVSNRGFNPDGTHTIGDNIFDSPTLHPLGVLTHPKFILPSRDADEFSFLYRRGGINKVKQLKYRALYPWVLRYQQCLVEGPFRYVTSRFKRVLASLA